MKGGLFQIHCGIAIPAAKLSGESAQPGILELLEPMRRVPKGPARDYAEAMAQYVVGVLVKEHPDGQVITSPFSRYRELFGSALDGLTPHRRPYARLLCAVMRFALNDIKTMIQDTGLLISAEI